MGEKTVTSRNGLGDEKPGSINKREHLSAPLCGFLRLKPASQILPAEGRHAIGAAIVVKASLEFDLVLDPAHPCLLTARTQRPSTFLTFANALTASEATG
jgi:hypothetical protein